MSVNAYLQFEGVTKSFPGVRALSGVSFGAAEGSVHALLGENGAGKSTLLKILSGVYRADAGQLLLGGRPQTFRGTVDALRAGVAVIYQELQLVPQLSVAENLFLGHLPNRGGWVDRRSLRRQAAEQLALLGEDINPRVQLGSLPIGQRQMVEIAKALARDAKVIAFDEPTSSLSSRETDRLFAVIKSLRDQGKAILYVSHRMDEIYATCDAATVLRDGHHVQTYPRLGDVTRDELVRKMVGRSIADVYNYTPRKLGPPLLEVTNLSGPGLAIPASFTVREGEILGFFGLIGAGRSELMRLVYGAARPTGGRVALRGVPLNIRKPPDAIRSGIVLLPEDRKKDGIVPVRSVQENTNISARRHFSPLRFFISYPRERANADRYAKALAVKTPSLGQEIRLLSGGNQQKVIIGRWLGEDPKVVLFDEPTRGIDVGAKSEIYRIIYSLAEKGVAVVVVSSELPEVMGISDRICVMRQGRIAGAFERAEFSQERLLAAALPETAQTSDPSATQRADARTTG